MISIIVNGEDFRNEKGDLVDGTLNFEDLEDDEFINIHFDGKDNMYDVCINEADLDVIAKELKKVKKSDRLYKARCVVHSIVSWFFNHIIELAILAILCVFIAKSL